VRDKSLCLNGKNEGKGPLFQGKRKPESVAVD
jgi:hypothetical protein